MTKRGAHTMRGYNFKREEDERKKGERCCNKHVFILISEHTTP